MLAASPRVTNRQADAAAGSGADMDARRGDLERNQLHATEHPATITISGFAGTRAVSQGKVTIVVRRIGGRAYLLPRRSIDPIENAKGVIQPLAKQDLPLLAWRLRDIAEPRSDCCSQAFIPAPIAIRFCRWQDLGMDLDGPPTTRALCARVHQAADEHRQSDVISWSSIKDKTASLQESVSCPRFAGWQVCSDHAAGLKAELANSYFVVNFTDYRFLQVFYPLAAFWPGTTAQPAKAALAGADDPRYVHTDAVWSPDEKFVSLPGPMRESRSQRDRSSQSTPTLRTKRRSNMTSIAFLQWGKAARLCPLREPRTTA